MSGKWLDPTVPKRGWSCTSVTDLGRPDAVCEMCEAVEIRYVHTMAHPAWPEQLACGHVCAGHMEGDENAAARREQDLKNRGARRDNWLGREWRTSRKGNPFLNVDGKNVVIFRSAGGWGFRVADRDGCYRPVSRFGYRTQELAMLGAFDAVSPP
jgi:hypothetical protein